MSNSLIEPERWNGKNIARDGRIRFSMCSTGLKQEPIESVLDVAQGIGLQGIELWAGHLEEFQRRGGTPSDLRRLLESRGLEVPAISEYTYFSKGQEERKGELERIRRAAEWAAGIGCPRIRTFAGHQASRATLAVEWDGVVSGLSEALQLCRAQGVQLAVEIHNNTLADTPESLAALLRDVSGEGQGLELIYDGFNLFVDHLEPVPVLEQFFADIRHVHFKDYKWNHQDWGQSVPVPVLQGDAGHAAILQKLLDLGYEGFISFEYLGDYDQVVLNTKRSLAEVRGFDEQLKV